MKQEQKSGGGPPPIWLNSCNMVQVLKCPLCQANEQLGGCHQSCSWQSEGLWCPAIQTQTNVVGCSQMYRHEPQHLKICPVAATCLKPLPWGFSLGVRQQLRPTKIEVRRLSMMNTILSGFWSTKANDQKQSSIGSLSLPLIISFVVFVIFSL